MISWAIIFVAMLKGHGQLGDVALLTITSGHFAQVFLTSQEDQGFHEISELGSHAISIYKSSKPLSLATAGTFTPSKSVKDYPSMALVSQSTLDLNQEVLDEDLAAELRVSPQTIETEMNDISDYTTLEEDFHAISDGIWDSNIDLEGAVLNFGVGPLLSEEGPEHAPGTIRLADISSSAIDISMQC